MRIIIPAVLIHVLLMSACDKPGDPQPDPLGTNWQLVESWPSSDINSLVRGDTLWVAVGNDGVVHTSTDGLDWVSQSSELIFDLRDIAWTGSEFVAVGAGGIVGTSSDGITWTAEDISSHALLYSVAGNSGRILAAGYADFLVSTVNGVDWIQHSSGINITFEDILIDDTLWLACGDSGMTATSPDGFVWTRRAGLLSEECRLVSLTKAGDDYFAVGNREPMAGTGGSFVYSSPDGLAWSLSASLDDVVLHSITWSGTEFVAVGKKSLSFGDGPESVVMTSPDGAAWQEASCDAPRDLRCAAAASGVTMTAGDGGYIVAGSSPDDLKIVHSGATIQNVVYDGNRFVGVTNFGTIVSSSNGSAWDERHSRIATYFSKLVFSRGKYVAVGGFNYEARSIFFSSDGITWTQVWDPVGGEILDMVHGGGTFLGVGEYGHVFLSQDGQAWTRIAAVGAIDLRSAAWSGHQFLALGDSTAHISTDGASWSSHDIEVSAGSVIRQTIWAEDKYRAVGYRIPDLGDPYYCFFSSADGYKWTAKKLQSAFVYPSDLIWTGARYFLYGRYGTLMTSVDGEEWEVLDTGTESHLTALAVSTRRLILAGADRTVLLSER